MITPLMRDKNRAENKQLEFDAYWAPLFKQIRDNLFTYHGEFTEDTKLNYDEAYNDEIYQSSATWAHNSLTDGICSATIPASIKWMSAIAEDKDDMEVTENKRFLDDLGSLMLDMLKKGNFYRPAHNMVKEASAFSVGAMFIEEDLETRIWCQPLITGSFFLGKDERGKFNYLCRKLEFESRDVLRLFGEDNVSSEVLNDNKNNNFGNKKIKVTHVVERNYNFKPGSRLAKDMLWRSVYFEDSSDGRTGKYLSESGYEYQPFIVFPWGSSGSRLYSDCPAMHALPDMKEMQELISGFLAYISDKMSPAWLADSALRGKTYLDKRPNGITYVDGLMNSKRPAAVPLFDNNADIQAFLLRLQQLDDNIRRHFFADLLLKVSSTDTKQQTATEVIKTEEEKLRAFGPITEAIEFYVISPLFDILYHIIQKQGLLEPPESMIGKQVGVKVVSLLARAQLLSEFTPIENFTTFAQILASMNPNSLDKIDFDQVVDVAQRLFGVDSGVVRSDEDVEELRNMRAQVEAEAVQQEKETQNIQNMNSLSQTQVTPGENALQVLTGGVGGG